MQAKLDLSVEYAFYTHFKVLKLCKLALTRYEEGVVKLLSDTVKGVLIIFIGQPGCWKRFVRYIHKSVTTNIAAQDYREKIRELEMEREYFENEALESRQFKAEYLKKNDILTETIHLADDTTKTLERIKIINALDFLNILIRLRKISNRSFLEWFEQEDKGLPLILDSLIRLQFLGASIPVLHYDIEVLFSRYNNKSKMLMIRHAKLVAVRKYRESLKDANRQVFSFSSPLSTQKIVMDMGSTKKKEDSSKPQISRNFMDWAVSFSTELAPCLLVTKKLCNSNQFLTANNFVPEEVDLNEAFNLALMQRYLGIQFHSEQVSRVDSKLMSPGRAPQGSRTLNYNTLTPKNVSPVGIKDADIENLGVGMFSARSLGTITRGVGYCMSNIAALDIPPFSNFPFQVNSDVITRFHNKVLRVDEDDSELPPDSRRAPHKDMDGYINIAHTVLEVTLPTFVRESIFDCWISSGEFGYIEKYPEIAKPDSASEASQMVNEFCYVSLIRKFLEEGTVTGDLKLQHVRDKLKIAALARIKEIFFFFRTLVKINSKQKTLEHTFASLWVTGAVSSHNPLRNFCNADNLAKSLTVGSGLVEPTWTLKASKCETLDELPVLLDTDLNSHMLRLVEDLIENAIGYLEMTSQWPRITQVLRSKEGKSIFTLLK